MFCYNSWANKSVWSRGDRSSTKPALQEVNNRPCCTQQRVRKILSIFKSFSIYFSTGSSKQYFLWKRTGFLPSWKKYCLTISVCAQKKKREREREKRISSSETVPQTSFVSEAFVLDLSLVLSIVLYIYTTVNVKYELAHICPVVYLNKFVSHLSSGVGKGLVGVVTRPTSGVIDFASSSFEGIRRWVECCRISQLHHFVEEAALSGTWK